MTTKKMTPMSFRGMSLTGTSCWTHAPTRTTVIGGLLKVGEDVVRNSDSRRSGLLVISVLCTIAGLAGIPALLVFGGLACVAAGGVGLHAAAIRREHALAETDPGQQQVLGVLFVLIGFGVAAMPLFMTS